MNDVHYTNQVSPVVFNLFLFSNDNFYTRKIPHLLSGAPISLYCDNVFVENSFSSATKTNVAKSCLYKQNKHAGRCSLKVGHVLVLTVQLYMLLILPFARS